MAFMTSLNVLYPSKVELYVDYHNANLGQEKRTFSILDRKSRYFRMKIRKQACSIELSHSTFLRLSDYISQLVAYRTLKGYLYGINVTLQQFLMTHM